MRTRRERRSRRALATLGEARFVAFLRAVHDPAGCYAVTLFLEHLDSGHPVNAILFNGEPLGFELAVEAMAPAVFRIEFSCQVDPMLGDGGTWDVGFDAGGAVISVAPGVHWNS